jgi:hypothetical protein
MINDKFYFSYNRGKVKNSEILELTKEILLLKGENNHEIPILETLKY